MARIRTIKPEFWTSEQVVDCSPTARLLFVGMWNFCDDYGIHPASCKQIKMEVFPGDSITTQEIESLISELLQAGLIRQYTTQGRSYWLVTGWHHQKIEKKNKKYPHPLEHEFDDQSTTIRRPVDDHSPPESSLRESKGKEGKGYTNAVASPSAVADSPPDVVVECSSPKPNAIQPPYSSITDTWNKIASELSLPRCECLSEARRRVIRQRWKSDFWRENYLSALGLIRGSPFLRGENDRGWVANIDWFLRGETVTKLIEGAYSPAVAVKTDDLPF
ncbi:hypothetical protein EBZ39_03055 [bacterium]|nr:hypothetical protein [bacterium]